MCREGVDVGEGDVAEAGYGAAIVEDLADFVAAVSHLFKPVIRDCAEFGGVVVEPGVDGGVAGDASVQSKQPKFWAGLILSGHLCLAEATAAATGGAGRWRAVCWCVG